MLSRSCGLCAPCTENSFVAPGSKNYFLFLDMHKRTFIKNISLLGISPAFFSLDQWLAKYETAQPDVLAREEDFWQGIRGGYKLKPGYINLENGYYCFCRRRCLNNLSGMWRDQLPGSYYMRTRRFDDNHAMAAKLAALAAVPEKSWS